MTVRVEAKGFEKAIDVLGRLAARHSKDAKIVVGYAAPYAARIHEDLQMRHTNGQAKYLEAPARYLESEMASLIAMALAMGRTLEQALLQAGQRLLIESQTLVPVDTGFLKNSGYVKVE